MTYDEDPRVKAIRSKFAASDRAKMQARKEADRKFILEHGPQAYLELLRERSSD